MTVTPKVGLDGQRPCPQRFTAKFPKLQKRLINQDPVIDPSGDFADGDPTDPNYGKETGGIYTVEVALSGTAVKGSVDLVVLPSGSADISLGTLRFATELGLALDAARQAVASGDATAISSAKGALAAISQNLDYSPRLLAANNVAVPVNGFPVTYSQVAARFPASPDDANYGRSIDAIAAQLRLIRARINKITAASLTQADVDALTAGLPRAVDGVPVRRLPSPVGVTPPLIRSTRCSAVAPLLLDSTPQSVRWRASQTSAL